MDFKNFQKSNFVRGKFLNRFSRLDVSWVQGNKQSDKQSIYINIIMSFNFESFGDFFYLLSLGFYLHKNVHKQHYFNSFPKLYVNCT